LQYAFRHPWAGIQAQQAGGGAAHASEWFEDGASDAEMFFPAVFSRMKQADGESGSRIEASHIAAFVAVTQEAGECQVSGCGGPGVFAADDVIDLVEKPASASAMRQ
jgi:hypothetical protein